jgi:hypothetical protein
MFLGDLIIKFHFRANLVTKKFCHNDCYCIASRRTGCGEAKWGGDAGLGPSADVLAHVCVCVRGENQGLKVRILPPLGERVRVQASD